MAIVVDIGGTSIRAGVAEAGRVPMQVLKTPRRRDEILEALRHSIERVLEIGGNHQLIVVGCPGLINWSGVVQKSLYLDLAGVDLKRFLEKFFKQNVIILNDANLQATGLTQKYQSALYVVFGTGVGGAIMLDRTIYQGIRGFAGEMGHMPLSCSKKPCACGRSGCMDASASGVTLDKELGENWWQTNRSQEIRSKLTKLGIDCGALIVNVAKLLDLDRVVVAGHLAGYDEFRAAVQIAAQECEDPAAFGFEPDTWPLVTAGGEIIKSRLAHERL